VPRGLGEVKDDARGLIRKPLQAGDKIKAEHQDECRVRDQKYYIHLLKFLFYKFTRPLCKPVRAKTRQARTNRHSASFTNFTNSRFAKFYFYKFSLSQISALA